MWTLPFRLLVGLAVSPFRVVLGLLHRRAGRRHGAIHLVLEGGSDVGSVQALIHRLHQAASDPTVYTLLIEVRAVPAGWATTSDLRAAIGRLRAAGKRVVAWLESPDNASMWLASACDEIAVAPGVDVALTGVGTELTFGGAALARLGVQPDFEAAGAYKSFGETFTRTYASAESREATEALLHDLQATLVNGIAKGRDRTPDQVVDAMARAPLGADVAAEEGWIDRAVYLDVLIDELEGEDEAHPLRAWRGWSTRNACLERLEGVGRSQRVAVLHLEGAIVFEDSSARHAIRAREVCDTLDALRQDDKVKAVVLHINSPGGSAHASDRIWRDVVRLTESKTVVACFADVSASGGFYLAAPAHAIIARPETLTGSIGVFGGKLVVGDAMRKLGVHSQPLALTPSALMLSPSRRFDGPQRAQFKASLQRMYDGFVERVAAGRGRPIDEVEPLCRGRVWSGQAAADRGLVDGLGDLEHAVYRAAELAKLSPGSWVRRDLSLRPNPVAAAVSRALRLQASTQRPAAWATAQAVPVEAQAWAETVVQLTGTPMALLPFPWRVR